jgi:hypothetical protein
MGRSRLALIIGLAMLLPALGTLFLPPGAMVAADEQASPAYPVPHFATAGPVPILTTEDMRGFGLFYPDMPVGVVQGPDQRYLSFGPGGSFAHIGPGRDRRPTGTYKFVGTLDHIVPAKTGPDGPLPSLVLGRLQPSPDGSDFDRDYAGGGPTYAVTLPGRQNQPILVQLYHGEYQPDYPRGRSYGGAGIAVSRDWGDNFTKLGQILGPHVPRDAFFAGDSRGSIFTDGFLVEADAKGNHIAARDPDPASVYEYLIFADRASVRERPALVIARIAQSELLDAVAYGRAPGFKRYYAPPGDRRPATTLFTESGIGGAATPIVQQDDYLAQPEAVYDDFLRKFVLVYMVNQRSIMLRTAENLFHWSNPVTVIPAAADPDLRVFYPSLVGVVPNPQAFGSKLYLFYLQRTQVPDHGNDRPRLVRVTITLTE